MVLLIALLQGQSLEILKHRFDLSDIFFWYFMMHPWGIFSKFRKAFLIQTEQKRCIWKWVLDDFPFKVSYKGFKFRKTTKWLPSVCITGESRLPIIPTYVCICVTGEFWVFLNCWQQACWCMQNGFKFEYLSNIQRLLKWEQ